MKNKLNTPKTKTNINGQKSGTNWIYSDIVKEHFFRPKNYLTEKEEKKFKWNGVGEAGSSICGDVMRVWIWVDPKTQRIKKCKWRTFGCASAIATTSMMSIIVTEKGGMKLEDAEKLTTVGEAIKYIESKSKQ